MKKMDKDGQEIEEKPVVTAGHTVYRRAPTQYDLTRDLGLFNFKTLAFNRCGSFKPTSEGPVRTLSLFFELSE